jgi:1D-myo-inositol 3-kinase
MPRFLVVGHLVQDLMPGGWRLGGTAAYASLTAARLGLEALVVTSASFVPQELEGVQMHVVPSPVTTQFHNIYEGGRRRQVVTARAQPLGLRHIPPAWRGAEIVLLGPVVGEVPVRLAAAFPRALVGACLQGWLRHIGPGGEVGPRPAQRWRGIQHLRPCQALFVSDEDISSQEAGPVLERWAQQVLIVAYTRGERGAEVAYKGIWRHIDAFPAVTVDPTGAGDVFAAAFLVALWEGADAFEAARFASAAASLVVEREGLLGVPWREQVASRLQSYPDIVCR